jgi:K+/H+ antiporter YhaU regulatory subunit KhtT
MASVISLFVVLILSLVITRIGTVALAHTGVSRQLARFQARSAFTGVGFTTKEAEAIVAHPVRRRIVMMLMLLGNVGVATAVSSLVLAFVDPGESTWLRALFLVGGCVILLVIARSKWLDRHTSRLIERALDRFTDLEVRDYVGLLHLAGDYRVTEMRVEEDDWMANRDLAKLDLRREGVLVLGVERSDGRYLGAPGGDSQLRAGDIVILYGRTDALSDLDERRRGSEGERAHRKQVSAHERVQQDERVEDKEAAER